MPLSCCVTLGKLFSLSVLQYYHQASLLMVESLPAVRETWVPSLGREDPLEEGMATRPIFHWSCERELGIALESRQVKIDLI